jgi:membrane protein implicated in regulation of membrane protease activity
MKFLFNLVYWMILSIVLCLLLFYVPTFAIIVIGVILVAGIVGGILLYKYRRNRR